MAEGTNPDEGTPWWNSWLQTAKDKSTTAYEFFKRDLTEFSSTVQQDTAQAVSSTAAFVRDKLKLDGENSVTSKAKEGLTSLIGSISEALSPTWDPADDELSVIRDNEVHPVDRWQACLHSILVDRNTYCHEPDAPPEVYESWLETFSMSDHKDEIAEILLNYGEVQRLYDELVPGAVPHEEFWQRYFFRAYQLWQAEEELVNSVQQSSERLSVSGDTEHLLDAFTGPNSRFLGSRAMVVPPNTPNAPSAEQSGSNSPQPSKAAPPSPAGDAGCDVNGPLTPEEDGEEDERTLPNDPAKVLEAEVLEPRPSPAVAVLAARLTSEAEAAASAAAADSCESRSPACANRVEEQAAPPTAAGTTIAETAPEALGGETSATVPGPGSESSSGKDLSDWEEFELELADTDTAATASVAKPASHSASEGDDDWEKWE